MLASTKNKVYSTGDISQVSNTGLPVERNNNNNINCPRRRPFASIWSLSIHSTHSYKMSSQSMTSLTSMTSHTSLTSPTSLVSTGSCSSASYKDAIGTVSFIPTSILLPVALASKESLTGASQSGVSLVQPSVSAKAVYSVLTVGSSTYLSNGTPETTSSLASLSGNTSSPVPTPSSGAASWASPISCHGIDEYRSVAASELSVIQQQTDITWRPRRIMHRYKSMGDVNAAVNAPVKEFWLSTQSMALPGEDLSFESTHPKFCEYSRSSSSGFISDDGHHSIEWIRATNRHEEFYDNTSADVEYFAAVTGNRIPGQTKAKKGSKKTIFGRIISLFTCCFKKNKNDH